MNSTAIAKIDLNALLHNLAEIRRIMPAQKILAMIKSNAYGHGLIPIAKTVSTVDALGVATLAEAMQLRAADIKTDIVVMRGFSTSAEITPFLNDPHLIACFHSAEQFALLQAKKIAADQSLRIWMKIETGMHLLGIPPDQVESLHHQLQQAHFIKKPFVICSHLADADNRDPTFTQFQINQFKQLTKKTNAEKSLLNSAGILAHSQSHYDWIRPGLLLYGVSPFELNDPHNQLLENFKPVMTIESRLIAIKKVHAGEKIGYSCTFTAPREMKTGIVGMGYGDSYPRQAKNGTPVLIRGEHCPIVGRVSMDMFSVDVSTLPDVAVDDVVTLWGRDLLVSEIAQCVNTVPHELLCHLTGRVQMTYDPLSKLR